jgi:hypothetical protein
LAACPASSAPSSGIAISRAKAVMLETPGMLVRMAKRSARLAFASIIWRIALRPSRSADRSVRGAEHSDVQQRERESVSAVFGCCSILHQGLASDVKLLQFDEGLASSRARFQFQQGPHASQDRRIQAIGLRQLAGRLGEAARLTHA